MLSAYYRKAVLIPFGVVLASNFIYMGIVSAFSTYKSEWLTTESIFPLLILMALINALVVAVLSLTIFLNYYPQIKNRFILNALSWFLCPLTWIAAIFIKGSHDLLNFSDGVDSSGIFTILNTLPYVIGLVWSYMLFRINSRPQLASG